MVLRKEHFTHPASVALLTVLALVGATFVYKTLVYAATYTFTQTSWATLDASTVATHTSNQNNWSKYTATSTGTLALAGGVSLGATSYSVTDDGVCSGVATGGTVTYSGGYCVHTFNSVGTSAFTPTSGVRNVEYLVVAGGGAGSSCSNCTATAGGASGSLLTGSGYSVSPTHGAYTVTIGGGGVVIANDSGGAGGNSVFDTMTASGGTGGVLATGGIGGAGAGGVASGSTGGIGVTSSIAGLGACLAGGTAPNCYYGGGGGGGVSGVGGLGGGGNGGSAGIAASGGGGGGYGRGAAGTVGGRAGGSGVVIIRYPYAAPGFEYGANSSTAVSGTGSSASVGIAQGALTAMSPATIAGGTGTYANAISADGTSLYVTNSSGGVDNTLSMYPRNTSTGALSARTNYSLGTYASPFSVAISPDGTSVYSGNMGSTTISMYSRNTSTGALTALATPTIASGDVRAIAISADGTSVYSAASNGNSVYMFSRNTSTGALTSIGALGVATYYFDSVAISPDGTSVYATFATGASDYVYLFTRNTSTGALTSVSATLVAANTGPESIAISADGTSVYVTNYTSNTVSMYSRNTSTGALTPLATPTISTGTGPRIIAISPDGTSVYVTNYTSNTVSMYSRNTSTGALTPLATPTISTGTNPFSVSISADGTSVYVTNYTSNTVSMYSRAIVTSGTFTSGVIDTGMPSGFTTLAYSTTLNGQTITMDARAGNTATPDGTWTSWQTGIASGGSISGLAGNRYIQYRANLSTTNTAVTPTLNDVTINYTQYATSGDLTSSIYNTGNAANLVARLTWLATGTTTNETIKFQVRSSPDGSTWSAWCGYSDCSGSTYFTDASGNGADLASNHPLRSGADDQYFQYKVFLASAGGGTPTLTSVAVKYVVNAPPDFDTTYGNAGTGAMAYQIATTTDANYGKVSISYSVRDIDTTSGTTNPGYVTPSFEYSTTGSAPWLAIPSGDLQASNITNKFVSEGTYATYTAIWTASSTLPGVNNSALKVRVTVNDNEAANNTAQAVSAALTLDTAAPTVYATLDSSTGGATVGTVVLTTTDATTTQYRLCNDNTFPATDAQGNSCGWSALGGNLASSTIAWVPTGSPSTETVYLGVRDAYGNVNTTKTSMTAPAKSANFLTSDVSNPAIDIFREILSWQAISGAVSYEIYYAYTADVNTTPTSYSLLTTTTSNVYDHVITVATTSAYWYEVTALNANGDESDFVASPGDVPDSFGNSLPDITAPSISAITVPSATLKSTSAAVTFTTSEIATSSVRYGTSHDATCGYNSGDGKVAFTSGLYVTSQSVSLSSLIPNTTYYFCVNAADVVGNVSSLTDGGSFTTAAGPAITSVTATNIAGDSATIEWNTSTSSDSYAFYSTSSSLANPLTKGTADPVTTATSPGVYHHQIGLTGLSAGVRYYYSVKSTDSDGNFSTDDNSTLYYNFITTTDTTAPTITGISTPVISSTAAVITWQTDEPATTQVMWGTASGTLDRTTVLDSTKSVYHIVPLSSATVDTTSAAQALTATTPYFFRVFSNDATGNQASSSVQTFSSTNDGQVQIVTVNVGGAPTVSYAGSSTAADTTPPVILSVGTGNVKAFSADVRVSTNKDTVASVEYGESVAYGSTAGDRAFSTSKVIPLNNLREGSTYHYNVAVVDKFGNITASDDKTFDTTFISEALDNLTSLQKATDVQNKLQQLIESSLPSLAPPFITAPVVSNITENSASIAWKTNVKTMGTLRYATDAEYLANKNDYKTEVGADPIDSMAAAHTVDLATLTPNTLYHFQARSYVFPQVVGSSPDTTFSTKAAALTPNIVAVRNDGFTVVWQTDEPTSSTVSYRNQATGQSAVITSEKKETYHNVEVKNIPSGATYSVSVSGTNAAGNTMSSVTPVTVTTSVDTTPPVISNFKVDNALIPGRTDLVQTVVGWQTDKPANSAVYYAEGAGASASSTAGELSVAALDTYSNAHIMILSSLKSGTVYRIRIVSTDQSGNVKTFGPTSIITPQQTQSVLDIIVKNFESTFKFLGAGK